MYFYFDIFKTKTTYTIAQKFGDHPLDLIIGKFYAFFGEINSKIGYRNYLTHKGIV